MAWLHPGVYIEEVASGAKPVEGASTSIAAFVGKAVRGRPGQAVLVHSWGDYQRAFGPVAGVDDAMGLAVSSFYLNGGKDAYVARLVGAASTATLRLLSPKGLELLEVRATSPGVWGNQRRVLLTPDANSVPPARFTLSVGRWSAEKGFEADETFAGLDMDPASARYVLAAVNGQSSLISVALLPAADPAGATSAYQVAQLAGKTLVGDTTLKDALAGKTAALTLNLNTLGARTVSITPAELALKGTLADDGPALAAALTKKVQALAPERAWAEFSAQFVATQVVLKPGGAAWQTHIAVKPTPGADLDLLALLGLGAAAGAKLTRCDEAVMPAAVTGALLPSGQACGAPLQGGQESAPLARDYASFFGSVLRKIRDVSILVLPGANAVEQKAIVDAAVSHCEDEQVRNRMLLVDLPNMALDSAADYTDLGLTTSTYTALYYPWLEVANPLFDATRPDQGGPTLTQPPSASVAGLWARTDGKRGVWKAPAGVEAALLGVMRLAQDVGDGEQDQLNPLGVNCLRKMPGFGPVVWGSRTLSTKAQPEWRYVPVRRTAIMIEQSIFSSIQWAVFEPNDHRLWAALRINIESFMNGLWRAGAFQGEKAADAYFVRCSLGDTMTQGDIDAGRVIVEVGFAPLKPAEFVIVRIQQKVAQQ
jgi:uncharacterized protein